MPPRTATAADDPPHLRTAWHPLLVMLLELLLPRDHWKVLAEHALTREPRRIDVVIVRQLDASAWRPRHLRSVLDDLRAHNLVHFKGATDELEVVDALQLLSYAYQYMALNGLHHTDALSLRVVAPTLTPRFRAQLRVLGGALSETAVKGVHTGHVQGISLRVVETDVAWPAPGEHLLFPISPACLRSPTRAPAFDDNERALYYRLLQGISQLAQDPTWRVIMKDATLVNDTTREALMDLLAARSSTAPLSTFRSAAFRALFSSVAPRAAIAAGAWRAHRASSRLRRDCARSMQEAARVATAWDAEALATARAARAASAWAAWRDGRAGRTGSGRENFRARRRGGPR
jgi:hypothetical protein